MAVPRFFFVLFLSYLKLSLWFICRIGLRVKMMLVRKKIHE